eukprot:m.169109 g.169109  ORF g.169109 m.169109 type:complete len:385 (+) comp17233_c2_seq4:36-1190(+)
MSRTRLRYSHESEGEFVQTLDLPDGHRLALICDEDLSIVDLRTGSILHEVKEAHEDMIMCLAVAGNGRQLATASNGSVHLWDAATLDFQMKLQVSRERVGWLAYSVDSALLATGGYDVTARLWRAADGQPLFILRSPIWCQYFAFAPDGRRILAAGCAKADEDVKDFRVLEWPLPGMLDKAEGRADGAVDVVLEGRRLRLHNEEGREFASAISVRDASFSWDCRRLCVLSARGVVYVLDAVIDASGNTESFRRTLTLQARYDVACIMPDGRRLAAGYDRTVEVLNASTGSRYFTLHCRDLDLNALRVSADGRQMICHDTHSEIEVQALCDWTPSTHRLFAPSFCKTVFQLMCVRARLDKGGVSLPRLPLELWLLVFEQLQLATQ